MTATSDGTSYKYDANGNMIAKQTLKGLWSYKYDAENRLIDIGYKPFGKAFKTIARYYYDGDGGRVKKVVYRYLDPDYSNEATYGLLIEQVGAPVIGVGNSFAVSTTVYVGNLYEVENPAAGKPARKTKSVFLGNTRVAGITGGDIAFYHQDHLGSTNVMSDKLGIARSLTEYDPFGKATTFKKYGDKLPSGWQYFHDKPFDDESGLIYFGGRYYDPKLGRFVTADTIVPYASDPQSLNRYSYCRNNPINLIDPSGHKWSWKKFFAAALGAIVAVAITVATGGAGGFFATAIGSTFWGGVVAGAVGGAVGGAINGGILGGVNGALQGAMMGAVVGGIGGGVGAWSSTLSKVGQNMVRGSVFTAGAANAAVNNSWDSFAGGLLGGAVGKTIGDHGRIVVKGVMVKSEIDKIIADKSLSGSEKYDLINKVVQKSGPLYIKSLTVNANGTADISQGSTSTTRITGSAQVSISGMQPPKDNVDSGWFSRSIDRTSMAGNYSGEVGNASVTAGYSGQVFGEVRGYVSSPSINNSFSPETLTYGLMRPL